MKIGACAAGVVRKHPVTWRTFDATDQRVGKLAQTLSKLLIGKHKPTYRPNIDNGDVCVVINAEKVVFTGKKWLLKRYKSHSGQPGKLKSVPAHRLLEQKPEEILRRAVKGMLPNNNTRKFRLERLVIHSGPFHPFQWEFAPSEVVPPKDDLARKSEATHRHAFVQKPFGPIFWKDKLKYKYSPKLRRKMWKDFYDRENIPQTERKIKTF
ncbi:54S ribosomal protein L23, mitochondrial [Bonamia ostreae]|uniref:54S ribosomal protein L23, mitochondrial n=1 Tax=Bonamia ostreae TaxID=126728 RepID=A0ABV2AQB5_9EUKA